MRGRRWAAIWLVAVIAAIRLGTTALGAPSPVQYQYDDQLPSGVLAVTVDGQPINASATPTIANRNPVFAGRLAPASDEVELALRDGEVIRFTLEVDPTTGRFQGRAPDPLDPATYTLFIDDDAIGDFVISGETAPAEGGALLDLASLVPFPADLEGIAGLGFVLDEGRYRSLRDAAREAAGEGAAPAAVLQAEQQLVDAGWRGRYDGKLAVPQGSDPRLFELEVSSFVIEYAQSSGAEATFNALNQGAGLDAETIGDASLLTEGSGVVGNTGAAFQSRQLVFRQDRLLFVVVLADLMNREPDQAALETLGQTLQGRAEAVLSGDEPGLSRTVVRIDPADVLRIDGDESYLARDGALVPDFNESAQQRAAREAAYAGAASVYTAAFNARLGGAGDEATPATEAPLVLYTVTLYEFADDGEAEDWMAGLGDRLDQDPTVGRFLAFSPLEDFPELGDQTAAFSLSRESVGGTASGFRFYVRVGNQIASVELAAAPEAPRTAVEELVEAQVACLEADACPDLAPLPAGLGQEAAG